MVLWVLVALAAIGLRYAPQGVLNVFSATGPGGLVADRAGNSCAHNVVPFEVLYEGVDGLSGRLRLTLGDLPPHVVHVEVPCGLNELLELWCGEGARLRVDHDSVAEDHQGRDRGDSEFSCQLLLSFRVYLAEHDVGVLL